MNAAADEVHPLPLGEDNEDSNEKNLRLLKRALIEKRTQYYGSLRSAGNEFFSNLPTFLTAATKGDAGYTVASACGLAIIGIIGYRGLTQNSEYKRALAIWVEFENNKDQNLSTSYEILSERMHDEGLLFSGIPRHNLQFFRETEHREAAEKYGLANNRKPAGLLNKIRLPSRQQILNWRREELAQASSAFARNIYTTSIQELVERAAPRADRLIDIWFAKVDGAADYIADQIKDGGKNILKRSTYVNIAHGFRAAAVGVRDYRVTAHRAREGKRIRPRSAEFKNPRLEENEAIHTTMPDDGSLKELKTTRADVRRHIKDGKIITSAFCLESGFFAAHFWEAYQACDEGDLVNLGVSIYSIMMASGAYAYLGREVSAILDAVESRRALMAQLYSHIETKYHTLKSASAPAPA